MIFSRDMTTYVHASLISFLLLLSRVNSICLHAPDSISNFQKHIGFQIGTLPKFINNRLLHDSDYIRFIKIRCQQYPISVFVVKNSDTTSWHDFCTSSARFAPILEGNQMVPNATKQYETHQNVSLVSNGVDRVHLLPKIPTRLRGTNFCTSSAQQSRMHPNSTKRTKTLV